MGRLRGVKRLVSFAAIVSVIVGRTNINSAVESVILTFRSLFTCLALFSHHLKASPFLGQIKMLSNLFWVESWRWSFVVLWTFEIAERELSREKICDGKQMMMLLLNCIWEKSWLQIVSRRDYGWLNDYIWVLSGKEFTWVVNLRIVKRNENLFQVF